jgi:uncharacterized circularly permuted ATP-grasp superfamily protein
MSFQKYDPGAFFDELFQSKGTPRPTALPLIERIQSLPPGELQRRQKAAEAALLQMGITFTVYGSSEGTERIFPFDIIPRIIDAQEWDHIERGLKQRITALNMFLDDIYHEQIILKEKVIPAELVLSGKSFRPECQGLNPPKNTWCHISGIDLVRNQEGKWFVLEDNLRSPSGVSYVLENREVLKETFPFVFGSSPIRPVSDYPNRLLELLQFISPHSHNHTNVVVLTPGVYNAAYFEHAFLAREMGIPLVEGKDLVVQNDRVYMRTTKGFEPVDVIYRRMDDDFLDPQVFRKDSLLGVPGIMQAYRKGNVGLANAPGTGIADDKGIYPFVPKIIQFYLSEPPILSNVPTFLCSLEEDRKYVLENLKNLVVKSVNESGGYGMLMGPSSSTKEQSEFAEKIKKEPRNFIAQPVLSLSRAPVLVGDRLEGRHVDLRPYILYGKRIYIVPGGLTRVALKKGSLVVNSSQGGGSKDTWVI